MNLNQKEIKKIKELIDGGNSFLIIPHKNPDGDTIGSALGLYRVLTNLGKSADVRCIDPPSEVFNFMPNIEKMRVGIDHLDYDVIIIVDVGATHLTGYNESHPELFNKSLEVINIDHHQSNNNFGKYNLVDPEAPSATMVVYGLLTEAGFEIDRDTATCLLTGLYTDTGSFMHSNTTAEAMRVGARLVAKGANLRSIAKDIFNTTKLSTMRLWGRVLSSTYQTPDAVTMAVVTKKDFEDCGADYSEITGVVDYINSVQGSKYSVILTERDGIVKGSLRTLREEVNVAEIAGQYGGGGHIKAAGFSVDGHLEKEIRWKVVEQE